MKNRMRRYIPFLGLLGTSAVFMAFPLRRNFICTHKKVDEGEYAFSPDAYVSLLLHHTEKIAPNTTRQRFVFKDGNQKSGLPIASFLSTKIEVDGKTITRPYTPVSLKDQKGFIDLIIKSYAAPDGVMSRHIQSLRPGIDSLEFRGPILKIQYTPNMKKNIGMIAGGTGITPMLQVIREILSNPQDETQVSLIFANVSEEDILLKNELDSMAYLYPNFKVYYTLDKPPKNWRGGVGYVSKEMIEKYMPPANEENMLFVCGPRGMMQHVCGAKGEKGTQGSVSGILSSLGYTESQVYKF